MDGGWGVPEDVVIEGKEQAKDFPTVQLVPGERLVHIPALSVCYGEGN